MLSLEYDIESSFSEYNLRCYFTIQKDCYRVSLFDEEEQKIMLFVPKKIFQQNKETVKYVVDFVKYKNPELFL